ncbi:RNA-polymerase II-associated protein 3-like,C-terminal domain [Ostreococcus tauri]|uniref:RNA-polymerase II-associated protein 3-like,C-terminal domain n=1 Tax=Ostreococcus tauri TaxID=70448 RepID=A0A096P912_OSTTA|nr:RNA-polymerase II-associated protein 3-like,C-terminal domain [Ostreococcus tauri]CEG00743.1 RNA-polymerase II-associated protein 3-like,C-terminal domain [Ostreococcus tauri]|eukprot:XP_022840556.1 RNA-polymerase II-associated protein 3-like,C-terminal domain [Ostreococcus tauri]
MNVEYASRDTDDVAFTRALERDVSRRAVEVAKKRAAGQRCNYDAFHQLVLGAELRAMKPLNATIENRKGVRVRRRSIDVTSTTRAHCGEVNWALTMSTPRNADEFARVWRRDCGDDDGRKTELLFNIPLDVFEVIFKAEIGLDLLRDFVRLIRARVEIDSAAIERAAGILLALTRCGRFRSHLRLAGTNTSRAATETLTRASELDAAHACLEAWSL